MTNFRLVQIESIYRQQNKCDRKIEISFERVENIFGKGENAGYQHFSPFSTTFSKGFLYSVVKGPDCVVNN